MSAFAEIPLILDTKEKKPVTNVSALFSTDARYLWNESVTLKSHIAVDTCVLTHHLHPPRQCPHSTLYRVQH